MIKFNKFNVTDTETKLKAKVFYSLDNRVDERKCVTIYANDYTRNLRKIFPEYTNETDLQSSYYDQGQVDLFEDHPLYEEARTKVTQYAKEANEKRKARLDKLKENALTLMKS